MAVYGAFEPGTYEAWALNLFSNIFITPGIARGMQVIPTSPASMAVQVTLDGTAGDGVCYLSNGCWLRIDTIQTLNIASNGTGATRTDAIVATVDPNGQTATSLAVSANWATGFTPGTNQFVVALISVPSGATSIASGNITMNSATATLTGTASGQSSSMVASDGIGLAVQDATASSTLSVVLTGLTSGVGRNVVIQTTDTSAIGHAFTFDTRGDLAVPSTVTAGSISASTIIGTAIIGPASAVGEYNQPNLGVSWDSSYNLGTVVLAAQNYPAGQSVSATIQVRDSSNNYFNYDFSSDGLFKAGSFGNSNAYITVNNVGPYDIHITPGANNWTYFNSTNNAHIDSNANAFFSGNVYGGSATFGVSNNYGSYSSPVVDFDLGYSDLRFWGDGGGHYIAATNAGVYGRELNLCAYPGNNATGSVVGLKIDVAGTVYMGLDDNGTATVRLIRHFEGGTDPASYATVNEGDIWYDG